MEGPCPAGGYRGRVSAGVGGILSAGIVL